MSEHEQDSGRPDQPAGAGDVGPSASERERGAYAMVFAAAVMGLEVARKLFGKSGSGSRSGAGSGTPAPPAPVVAAPNSVAAEIAASVAAQASPAGAARAAALARETALEQGESANRASEAATAATVRAPGRTSRAEDRIVPGGADPLSQQRWGTLWIVCSFLVAFAGGIGFLIAYWTGANNLLMGGCLALALGGFGLALVLWAHWLMPDKQAMEPREPLPSSQPQREAVDLAYSRGIEDVARRGMLRWMAAGFAGLLAAMVISLMRSLGMSPDQSLYTTVWKRGQRLVTAGGKVLRVDSLQPGSSITVFPENSLGKEKSQTVLIRVEEQLLHLPYGRKNWAPMGYLAYSRVCTHAGCPVGLYEATSHLLLCPCHQSTFDVLRGAPPTGGPAARALPQLPLYADSEGNLRAGGGFTAPPGPGFWGMP